VYRGGLRIGNLKLGGRKHGSFSDHFQFRVREDRVENFPLLPDRGDNPGLEWTRLAVPLPTMLPSLNQIGFDYLSWLIGPAAAEPSDQDGCGRLVCWAVGARRDQANQLQVDPTSDFIFPLAGQYRGSAYRLSNANFTMKITGIPIPFREFQLRGSLQPDLSAPAPPSVLAATGVLGIPNFGPAMVVAGLANRVWRELIAVGTYLTRPAPERRTGNPAVQRASVERFSFTPPGRSQPGEVSVSFQIPGDTLPAEKHRAGVLLLDPNGLQPVSLDYQAALSQSADQDGSLTGVLLQIPPGTQLPDPVRIIVLIDVQPVRDLTLPSRERHRS
jgi:hypothetical protein